MRHEVFWYITEKRVEAEYPQYEYGDFRHHPAPGGACDPRLFVRDEPGGGWRELHIFGTVYRRTVRHLRLRWRSDGLAAGGGGVPGAKNSETLSGHARQPQYAACCGISDLCALCAGVLDYPDPCFRAGLGRSSARLLGRICWQLAPDCTFYAEHWHDGGRYCQECQERKRYCLCAVFPHADFFRGHPAF